MEKKIYVVWIDYDDNMIYETSRVSWILDKKDGGGAFTSFEAALRAARKAIEAIANDENDIEAMVDDDGEYGYYVERACSADGYMDGTFSVYVVGIPFHD